MCFFTSGAMKIYGFRSSKDASKYQLCTCGHHLWSVRASCVLTANNDGEFKVSSADSQHRYIVSSRLPVKPRTRMHMCMCVTFCVFLFLYTTLFFNKYFF